MTAWIRGHASSADGDPDLEDRFEGRWNPRRAIQDDLRALGSAVADAASAAGWWEPGQTIDAGLVMAVDLHGWGHMETFLGTLRTLASGRAATLRPSTFLHALPSTPASTLGLLFGLERYQATINTGSSGFDALGHALDLLALGRLERVVVAGLSAVAPAVAARLDEADPAGLRLACAICLQAAGEPSERGLLRATPEAMHVDSHTLLADLSAGYRGLSAPSLQAVCQAQVNNTLVCRDPCFGGASAVSVVGPRG